MKKQLHLVFGGELVDPSKSKFKNINDVELVGLFPDYQTAYDAWKEASQRSVDNAMKRYFIARLSRLMGEGIAERSVEEFDD